MATQFVRPDPSRMYGLTHNLQGVSVVRVPRSLKVGIGVPKGRDIHVYINAQQKWALEVGEFKDGKRKPAVKVFDTKLDCLKAYRDALKTAPDLSYPRKLPYFTFLRPGPDGTFIHDFDAIAAHGPLPTEIEIVLLSNEPFKAQFEWWKAGGLKCTGDGINAMRAFDLANGPDQVKLVEIAKAAGERMFPIIAGCWTKGCPHAKTDCKPKGRLEFQLPQAPRLGGTAFFDTTSFRSVSQIHSCLEMFRQVTGRGKPEEGFVAGLKVLMVLTPYRVTAPNGKPSTQYGVRLEFRAEDAIALHRKLMTQADEFRAIGAQMRQISAPAVEEDGEFHAVDPGTAETIEAATMEAEFYTVSEDDDEVLEESGDTDAPATESEQPATTPRRKSEKGAAEQQGGE